MSGTLKHVGVVDPASTGQMYPPLLIERGARVTEIVTSRSRCLGVPERPHPGVARRVFVADRQASDPLEVLRALGGPPLDHVVAGSEPGVPLAVRLDRIIRPRAAVAPAEALYDKAAMMSALDASDVPNLAFRTLTSLEEARAFWASFDFRAGSLVLKPTVSAGSAGVVHVRSVEDAERTLRELLGASSVFGERIQAVVAQEFLTGTEYVVDTCSSGGEHSVSNVCAYQKTVSPDGRFLYDGIRWLAHDELVSASVTTYARAVLDAVGRTDGVAHLEIMLGDDGPRLIELGARPHGAGHPAKTQLLTGDSQVHQDVARLVSGAAPRKRYRLRRRGRIVFFHRAQPSMVTAADPAEAFAGIPAIESLTMPLTPGQLVPQTLDLADGLRLGLCFLVATSESELDEAEGCVRQAFHALFTPGS